MKRLPLKAKFSLGAGLLTAATVLLGGLATRPIVYRVQLRELTVIKRNGRRVPFDRDKLVRSVQISLRKRAVEPELVEQMVSTIVRELESGGEAEISSEVIGEIVMEHLRQLDDAAYVRFASVYRNFREAKDFEAVLGELSSDETSLEAARETSRETLQESSHESARDPSRPIPPRK